MASSVLTRSVRRHEKEGGGPTLTCSGCGGRGRFEWRRDDALPRQWSWGCAVRDVQRPRPDPGLVAPGPTGTALEAVFDATHGFHPIAPTSSACWLLALLLLHQQETQGHDDHAANETEHAFVSLAIRSAGWQQFIQADVHHDARDRAEEHAHHV